MGRRCWDYRGPYDLRIMQDLTSRIWRPGARWHIGDLAWSRYQHLGREAEWRTRLWVDASSPIAWAWVNPHGHLDLLVDPAGADVVPQILAWFEAECGRLPERLTVGVTDPVLIGALESAGYAPAAADEPHLVRLRHGLDGLPSATLPPGYRLDQVTEATLADRVVVVVDPTGTVVASCLAWYDPDARAGLLEPVATRPEHRRKGLAGAACVEALRRLRGAGATVATIGARGDDAYPEPLRVYRRIGFQPVGRDLTYVK